MDSETATPNAIPADALLADGALDETVRADDDGATPTPSPLATPSGTERAAWTGQRFDHYELRERIGEGGMGAVYEGYDISLDRTVAIKVLPEDLADEPLLQERFIREARAQARLQSAHVVHIYHVGRTPAERGLRGSVYFAMELVSGGALAALLQRGAAMDPERGRQLMLQAAVGLHDAQRAGLVHRDIKPGNLLLDHNNNLKIADFGVAKPLDGDPSHSQHGVVVGSPMYMPPEQAKGLEVDHRADMYSLGCTFYHLLTGEPIFDGPSPLAVVSKHMTAPPPDITEALPDIPPALAAIVMKLLNKEVEDRFESYDDLLQALEDAAPRSTQYAGFWVRGAAALIDIAAAGAVIGVIRWPGLFVYLVYLTLAVAYRGQTLGKYLLHLKVERTDGSVLSLGRSAARTLASIWMPFVVGSSTFLTEGFGELTSVIERLNPKEVAAVQSVVLTVVTSYVVLSLLYVGGLALAAFHPEKRAVHDLLVGSRVVYKLRGKSVPPRLSTLPSPRKA